MNHLLSCLAVLSLAGSASAAAPVVRNAMLPAPRIPVIIPPGTPLRVGSLNPVEALTPALTPAPGQVPAPMASPVNAALLTAPPILPPGIIMSAPQSVLILAVPSAEPTAAALPALEAMGKAALTAPADSPRAANPWDGAHDKPGDATPEAAVPAWFDAATTRYTTALMEGLRGYYIMATDGAGNQVWFRAPFSETAPGADSPEAWAVTFKRVGATPEQAKVVPAPRNAGRLAEIFAAAQSGMPSGAPSGYARKIAVHLDGLTPRARTLPDNAPQVSETTVAKLKLAARGALTAGIRWNPDSPIGVSHVAVPLTKRSFGDSYQYDAWLMMGAVGPHALTDPNQAQTFILVRKGGLDGKTVYSEPLTLPKEPLAAQARAIPDDGIQLSVDVPEWFDRASAYVVSAHSPWQEQASILISDSQGNAAAFSLVPTGGDPTQQDVRRWSVTFRRAGNAEVLAIVHPRNAKALLAIVEAARSRHHLEPATSLFPRLIEGLEAGLEPELRRLRKAKFYLARSLRKVKGVVSIELDRAGGRLIVRFYNDVMLAQARADGLLPDRETTHDVPVIYSDDPTVGGTAQASQVSEATVEKLKQAAHDAEETAWVRFNRADLPASDEVRRKAAKLDSKWRDANIMNGKVAVMSGRLTSGVPTSAAIGLLQETFRKKEGASVLGPVESTRHPSREEADAATLKAVAESFFYDTSNAATMRGLTRQIDALVGLLGTAWNVSRVSASSRAVIETIGGDPLAVRLILYVNEETGVYVAFYAREGNG